ncbi:MAG: PepSY domain-containing protein [Candidatus Cellulosilyticum pullistercoris]|uniref:PepSY domain-containing protein n=1 Tax=Candidatus Cellulosilyticum pullistercoris TaxID=2838521 RepID=A0A9E2KDR3_9FIRM|nr:PepSY domain-containing protein [Candidatus Cellulosilyticum pullistercoris]
MFKKALLLILILTFFTSCSNHEHVKQIDINDAKAIALSYYPNSNITSISFNDEHTTPIYSMDLTDETNHYEIEVNAIDGTLTEYTREPISSPSTLSIDQAKAKRLALNLHSGEITEFSLDESSPIPYYEITINDGTYEYELEINALTGEVIELNQEILDY